MKRSYNVVFKHTEKAGKDNAGKFTHACFESKQEFEEWYQPYIQELKEVVEKGVSLKKAVKMSDEMKNNNRLAEAVLNGV